LVAPANSAKVKVCGGWSVSVALAVKVTVWPTFTVWLAMGARVGGVLGGMIEFSVRAMVVVWLSNPQVAITVTFGCAGGYGVGRRERQRARTAGNWIVGKRGGDSARKIACGQRITAIQAVKRSHRDRACAVCPAIHGQAGWIHRQAEVRRVANPGNGINVAGVRPARAGDKLNAETNAMAKRRSPAQSG
jgi:hypothetical protein